MNYQDLWARGQQVGRGERECAARYALIKAFCGQYKRPFTVLDIGAAQGYFPTRLTEDFPDCTVVALEREDPPEAIPERVIWLRRQFTLDDLRQIATCEHFDLVLGLSVIHHFEGEFEERVRVFKSLGDHLILEFADEAAACGGSQKEYTIPAAASIIGKGASHLEAGHERDIVLLSEMKTSISKAYLGSPRDDLSLSIYSDFLLKRVRYYNKPEARDWLRGINLQTYLDLGGIWPETAFIRARLEARREEVLAAGHHDIKPWNVLLSGDDVMLIDARDPNMEVDFPDAEHFDRLIRHLAGEAVTWPR